MHRRRACFKLKDFILERSESRWMRYRICEGAKFVHFHRYWHFKAKFFFAGFYSYEQNWKMDILFWGACG